jgi:signal peptidase II
VKKYLFVASVIAAVVALDQLTKFLICSNLPLHQQIEVFHNFFHIVHVRNPGIAFGLLTEAGSRYRIPMLILISGVAVFIVGYFLTLIKEGTRLQLLCFSLLLGGAVGNLIDRFRLGAVIDFLDVHWYSSFHWPAFNVADSAITIGICLLALDMLIDMKRKKQQPAAGENSDRAPDHF